MDNKKYNYFVIVVNAKKESSNPREELEQVQSVLVSHYNTFVATIIHDQDTKENNEPKPIHAHAFIEMSGKYTCKQVLSDLKDITGLNLNQIQIEGTNNPYLQIQYLIHKNDANKHQYNDFEILTNDQEKLTQRLEQEYQTPTQLKEALLKDLKTTKSLIEFAEKHGVETANKYRNLFKDIKAEQRYDLKSVNEEIERYERAFKQLKEVIKNYKNYDGTIDIKYIENIFYQLDIQKSRF